MKYIPGVQVLPVAFGEKVQHSEYGRASAVKIRFDKYSITCNCNIKRFLQTLQTAAPASKALEQVAQEGDAAREEKLPTLQREQLALPAGANVPGGHA